MFVVPILPRNRRILLPNLFVNPMLLYRITYGDMTKTRKVN